MVDPERPWRPGGGGPMLMLFFLLLLVAVLMLWAYLRNPSGTPDPTAVGPPVPVRETPAAK